MESLKTRVPAGQVLRGSSFSGRLPLIFMGRRSRDSFGPPTSCPIHAHDLLFSAVLQYLHCSVCQSQLSLHPTQHSRPLVHHHRVHCLGHVQAMHPGHLITFSLRLCIKGLPMSCLYEAAGGATGACACHQFFPKKSQGRLTGPADSRPGTVFHHHN